MSTSIKKMNKALYAASFHLLEASKHMSNIEEFRPEAQKLLAMSDFFSSIIKAEPEKVTEDKMLSILDEIMGFNESEK
jgi:hypothetical protein